MRTSKRILDYVRANYNEVKHTTFDPEGPGVVRIHLVPPVLDGDDIHPAIVIINGQDIVPVNLSWTILLGEFIKAVNTYEGREINEADSKDIMDATVKGVRKVFPMLRRKLIENDISIIMDTFTDIAYGKIPQYEVGYMSMGEYAPNMRAPHRMDLLVSAMEKDGVWHCNQKCVHCYAAGQELVSETELSTEEWKKIIDRCRKAMIPQVTFTGGEPTMRDDLVELIDHARWFVTRLNTNGIRLTKELCKSLVEASLDSCQITFYSYDESIHNQLVGAPQYANTLAGIDNALEAGLSISINTPLCTLNKEYVKTLEFLHARGVRYVTCSGLITTGNALNADSTSLQLSTDEIRQILSDAAQYCKDNGMEISFTSPGWIENEFFQQVGLNMPTCGACLSNMAITPGGNVVPCQSYLSAKPLGSMLEDEWSKIWNSDRCAAQRDFAAKMTGECPLRRKTNE